MQLRAEAVGRVVDYFEIVPVSNFLDRYNIASVAEYMGRQDRAGLARNGRFDLRRVDRESAVRTAGNQRAPS